MSIKYIKLIKLRTVMQVIDNISYNNLELKKTEVTT